MTEQRDPDWEGDRIPWDVFFYRGPGVRNIRKDGVTYQSTMPLPPIPGQPSAFLFEPNVDHPWELELKYLLDRTNSIMYPVIEYGIAAGMRVWGDGVRLYLPNRWMHETDEHDMILAIIAGINVSIQNRHILNY